MNVFELFGKIGIDSKEAEGSINSIGEKAKGLGSKLGSMAGSVAKVGAGIAVGLGTAAVGAGVAIANMTDEFNKSLNGLAASTGATDEEMEKLGGTMKGIYANNFGDSMEDVAASIAEVKRQMSGLGTEELQKATEGAILLRDTFEFDVAESTRAADALMKNFGISSEEAFDLIAAGAQQGLNQNGDLLDTINEYSIHFKNGGYSADNFFNVLKSGGEAGAFSIDKVGDAFKEFGIRVKDQSKTTRDAFTQMAEAIGLTEGIDYGNIEGELKEASKNVEKYEKEITKAKTAEEKTRAQNNLKSSKERELMLNDEYKKLLDLETQLASGSETALQMVQEGFQSITDPLEMNIAGVGLFGTMWEDLGPEAMNSMMMMNSSLENVSGTMEKMNQIKYNSFGEAMEGIKRQLQVGLIDTLGVKLLPLMTSFSQFMQDNMPAIIGFISGAIEFLGGLINNIVGLFTTVKDTISGTTEGTSNLITTILTNIKSFIDGIITFITGFIDKNRETIDMLIANITSLIDTIITTITMLFNFIKTFLDENWVYISGAIEAFVAIVLEYINYMVTFIQNIIKLFVAVFTGDWEGALNIVKDLWNNFWEFLGNILNLGIEYIKNIVTLFVNFFVDIIKNIFNIDIDTQGFTDKFLAPFFAIIDWFKNVWTGLTDIIKEPLKAIEGVGEKIAGAAEGVKEKASGFFGKAKSFIGLKTGTASAPGGPVMVGEEGPELVELPKGSRVRTATNTKNILEKQATVPQQNNINEEFNFSGNNFVVREEADIKKIAKELYDMSRAKNRSLGIV